MCRSVLLLLVVGCAVDETTSPDPAVDTADSAVLSQLSESLQSDTDPCEDSPLTWESFGASYVWTWCTPCHSSVLVGEERQEAPLDVDFDTYEDVVDWAARIEARSGPGGDMPPAGGPDEAERELLVEWVSCGLP